MKKYYYNGLEILTPFSIISNEPHFDMTTVSLKTQRTSQNHQRWELSFNTIGTETTEVDSFFSSFEGIDSVKKMIMPQLNSVADSALVDSNGENDYPLVLSTTAGSSGVNVIGTSDINGILKKGSFIKFSNHDKIYVVTEDFDFTSSYSTQISIYPTLREAVVTGTTLKHGNSVTYNSDNTINVANSGCVLSYYVDINNQTGITFQDGILSNLGTISLIEAI